MDVTSYTHHKGKGHMALNHVLSNVFGTAKSVLIQELYREFSVDS